MVQFSTETSLNSGSVEEGVNKEEGCAGEPAILYPNMLRVLLRLRQGHAAPNNNNVAGAPSSCKGRTPYPKHRVCL